MRVRCQIVFLLAALVAAVFPAAAAQATDYVWNGVAGGDWNSPANWIPAAPAPNFNAGGGDTFTLNSGHSASAANETFGAPLTLNGTAILDVAGSTTGVASDLFLAGGRIRSNNGADTSRALGGGITVTSLSEIDVANTNHTLTLGATLSGAGGLNVLSSGGSGLKRVILTADNSGFSGGFTVSQNATLRAAAANSLGSGATIVNSTGILDIGTNITTPITVNPGGTVQVDTGNSASSSTVSASNLVLDDARILSSPGANGAQRTLNGAISVVSPSDIEVNGTNHTLTIGATITGNGLLHVSSPTGFPGSLRRLTLSADNSGFSGGFEVDQGVTLRATHANALGAGITNVNSTGSVDIGASLAQTINVNSGGRALVDSGSGVNGTTVNVANLHLNGGKLLSSPGNNGWSRTLTGNVFVDADSGITIGDSTNSIFTLSATLHGSSHITSGGESVGFGGQRFILPTDNTATFSGDWTINPNTISGNPIEYVVRLTNAGGLGAGGVQVNGTAVVEVGPGFTMNNDFSGTGTVRVRTTSGGATNGTLTLADSTVSPGASFGTLTFGDGGDTLVLGTTSLPSVLEIELGQAGVTDVLAVLGNLALDNVELQLLHPGDFDSGPFTISTITGNLSGIFSNDLNGVVSGITPDNEIFTASVTYGPNQIVLTDVDFQANVAAVPEPASIAIWSLFGLALCGYGYRRWRSAR